MKERTFFILLSAVLFLCVALSLCHAIYIYKAYEYASIIQFIAKEMWW